MIIPLWYVHNNRFLPIAIRKLDLLNDITINCNTFLRRDSI